MYIVIFASIFIINKTYMLWTVLVRTHILFHFVSFNEDFLAPMMIQNTKTWFQIFYKAIAKCDHDHFYSIGNLISMKRWWLFFSQFGNDSLAPKGLSALKLNILCVWFLEEKEKKLINSQSYCVILVSVILWLQLCSIKTK